MNKKNEIKTDSPEEMATNNTWRVAEGREWREKRRIKSNKNSQKKKEIIILKLKRRRCRKERIYILCATESFAKTYYSTYFTHTPFHACIYIFLWIFLFLFFFRCESCDVCIHTWYEYGECTWRTNDIFFLILFSIYLSSPPTETTSGERNKW